MHIKFLEYLRCPICHQTLTAADPASIQADRILEGELGCGSHNFPVIKGIPRFVPSQNYARSFGMQWKRWPKVQFESENVDKPMAGHTRTMFERILGNAAQELAPGHVVADIGCGPGRFIEQARSRGARVIGVDYSLAVEVAAENFGGDDDVCILQADALQLPIATNALDGIYSIGVLHHTPDAARAFAQMAQCVRPEGWSAVCVYSQGGHYDRPEVNLWRSLFRLLMPVFGIWPALTYAYVGGWFVYPLSFVPILGHVLRFIYPTVRLPDRNWRILDTFDSVTPSYQSRHTPFELYRWFTEAGYSSIAPTNWGMTSMVGQKISGRAIG